LVQLSQIEAEQTGGSTDNDWNCAPKRRSCSSWTPRRSQAQRAGRTDCDSEILLAMRIASDALDLDLESILPVRPEKNIFWSSSKPFPIPLQWTKSSPLGVSRSNCFLFKQWKLDPKNNERRIFCA
jgi:hypothetical protein